MVVFLLISSAHSILMQRLQREVTIWRSLKHPNVVQLYGIVYLGKDVYSVGPLFLLSHL